MLALAGSSPRWIATLLWISFDSPRTCASLVAMNVSPNSHSTRSPPSAIE